MKLFAIFRSFVSRSCKLKNTIKAECKSTIYNMSYSSNAQELEDKNVAE